MGNKSSTAKKRLKWFLNLINANVDSFSNSEILRYWLELREIAYGALGVFAFPDESLVKWDESQRLLKEIQKSLKDSLEKILNAAQKPKKKIIKPMFLGLDDKEQAYKELDKEGIAEMANILSTIVSSNAAQKPLPEWVLTYIAFTFPSNTYALVYGEKVFPFSFNLRDKVHHEFINALKEFSLNLILKCQRNDCGCFFLKATKREKRYCSNRCAWVMASRIKRMTQPEQEREKKRKSYHERKKRELGSKVKIQKRQK